MTSWVTGLLERLLVSRMGVLTLDAAHKDLSGECGYAQRDASGAYGIHDGQLPDNVAKSL